MCSRENPVSRVKVGGGASLKGSVKTGFKPVATEVGFTPGSPNRGRCQGV
jgi:hypothetical protein